MIRIGAIVVSLLLAVTADAANVVVDVGGMSTEYGGGGYGEPGTVTPILSFSPSTLTIDVGDTVTFSNRGGVHNVAADDGSFRCADGCVGDGSGASGDPSGNPWSSTVRFTRAGTFGYRCQAHADMNMRGSIVVRATSTMTLSSGLSGAWYNPAQSGHGFLVEQLPGNVLLAVWFVYSPDGTRQNWIYAQGSYDPGASSVTLPALLVENGRFPPNFDAARVTSSPWGTITLSFSDCNNGQATWASTMPGYGSGSLALARLAAIAGTSCP